MSDQNLTGESGGSGGRHGAKRATGRIAYFPRVVRWAGGKRALLKYLLPLIPPHRCYVEVFAGGCALLRAKEPSPVEVINDTHADLVNLFRCLRYHYDELMRETKWLLRSRLEQKDFLRQTGLTDIQRAARWWFCMLVGFTGHRSFGISKIFPEQSLDAARAALDAFHNRINKVTIESVDWRRCLDLYDSDETFFFIDPPYIGADTAMYKAFSANEISALAQALEKIKGRWLLTVNDLPEHRRLFAGCSQKHIQRCCGIANKKAADRTQYGELIVWRH